VRDKGVHLPKGAFIKEQVYPFMSGQSAGFMLPINPFLSTTLSSVCFELAEVLDFWVQCHGSSKRVRSLFNARWNYN
jgi:hypothetical protein